MTTKKTPAKTSTKSAEKTSTKAVAKDSTAKSQVKESHKESTKVVASAPPASNASRYAMIAILAVAAFFGAYRFASASQQGASGGIASATAGLVPAATSGGSAAGGAATGGGGGCCGGGGAPVEGKAAVAGGVQKISVDLSSGSYNPNVLKLKAGVPAEITFGASSGCTGQVQSTDLGFSEDLTSGPKTVKLGALKAGTYNFACGMNMVTGQIVVE